MGGITYRIFQGLPFGEIAFCAVTSSEQVGLGEEEVRQLTSGGREGSRMRALVHTLSVIRFTLQLTAMCTGQGLWNSAHELHQGTPAAQPQQIVMHSKAYGHVHVPAMDVAHASCVAAPQS